MTKKPKKERASQYEKKLSIDGSFKDVINIAMNVDNNNANIIKDVLNRLEEVQALLRDNIGIIELDAENMIVRIAKEIEYLQNVLKHQDKS